MTWEWTAPSGVRVVSCQPYVEQGGLLAQWKHYARMVAALQGWKWAYRP